MFFPQTQSNLSSYNQDDFPSAQKVQMISQLPPDILCSPA